MKKNQTNKLETRKPPTHFVNTVSVEYTEMLIRQVVILAIQVEILMNQLNRFYDRHGFRPIYYRLEMMKVRKQLKKVNERLKDYRELQRESIE